jgi:hypothetical protein
MFAHSQLGIASEKGPLMFPSCWRGFVLLAFSALTAISGHAQSYLYERANYPTGNNPAGIAVADFNGDHRPDLAVTNFNDNTVSILLANADGTFAPKMDLATGASPAALLIADFNGDGYLDIATANENDDSISILLGNGDGTFQEHVDYPAGALPVAVIAGDFNGDHKIDLVVAAEGDNAVSILLGNGDGSFEIQALVPVGKEPAALATGDFNNDGKADVFTSNNDGTVSVLLGKGNGSFTLVTSQASAGAPAVAVGDFNKDGLLDAVVANQFPNQSISLLLGKGDGTFQTPITIEQNSLAPVAYTCAVAGDFNHDGKLDLAVGGIVVYLGNGNGTFQAPLASPDGTMVLSSADINSDGQIDLLGTNPSSNSVEILLGNGNGTFSSLSTGTLAPQGGAPDAIVPGDFNGDGKADVVVVDNGFLYAELGNGNGTFQVPIISPLGQDGINNGGIMLTGDFNGDGKTDILIVDDYFEGFEVLMGNGNGSFQAAVNTPFSNGFVSLAVGDFNGDGNTDVALSNNGTGSGPLISIYLSNGDGTFRAATPISENDYPQITVADVNGDGKLDIISTSFMLNVYLGNGNGTFQNPISGQSDSFSGPPLVGDFNGDGKADVVAATFEGIAFLAGNGNGTFQNQVYSNPNIQTFGPLRTCDCNGDGKADLTGSENSTASGVGLMLGNGDGTFEPPAFYFSPGAFGVYALGDFNSDKVGDIAITSEGTFDTSTILALYSSTPVTYLFPAVLNFGLVPIGKTSPPQNVNLSNSGNALLKISAVKVTGDFVEQDNCGTTLQISQSCTIQVSFRPTTKDQRFGTLTLTDNASPGSQAIALRARGTAR